MTKFTTSAILLSLLSLSLTAQAGNRAAKAGMQVSFVISETCNVQSGTERPNVNCQFESPYQLKRSDIAATTTTAAAASPAATPAARAPDDASVWTVTF